MENKKKKIKGFTTRVGILLATAMLTLGPTIKQASAKQYDTIKDQEENKDSKENKKESKTDLEKYFNCQTPMNDNYKVDSQSEIYKILTYYEGREEAENGRFLIEKDAYNNLVVGSGLTIKYQDDVLEYLSNYGNTTQEILDNVTQIIDSGTNVYIPESIIDQIFIKEVQRCRDAAINDAKSFGINLSENQINILTELNYRYGKGNSGKLLSSLVQGQKLEDFTVKVDRSLLLSQWENIHLKIPTDVTKVENGKVYYTAYVKPFNSLGKEATTQNLKSSNISECLEEASSDQLEGDWRRCLFRQVGIENDVLTLIKDKTGECIYWEDGKAQTSNIVDYLEYVESKREEDSKQNLSQETINFQSEEKEQRYKVDETETSQDISIYKEQENNEIQNVDNFTDLQEDEVPEIKSHFTEQEKLENQLSLMNARNKTNLFNRMLNYIKTFGVVSASIAAIKSAKKRHKKKIAKTKETTETIITSSDRQRKREFSKNIVSMTNYKQYKYEKEVNGYTDVRSNLEDTKKVSEGR